ncbi:GNAT family N-acetyltransferase [Rhizobiaceae sp. 2RAB30]
MSVLHARPFEVRDISVLTGWFSSAAEIMQWAGPRLRWPLDVGQLAQLLRPIDLERDEWSAWSVCTADGDVVGHFQLRFDALCRQVTLGRVAIAPSQRGSGLALPMVHLALAKAFSIPSAHRVELRVYDFNEAAIRTYAKAGFVREGCCRESMPVGDAFWNTVIMGMLRPEWQARKA